MSSLVVRRDGFACFFVFVSISKNFFEAGASLRCGSFSPCSLNKYTKILSFVNTFY